MRRLRIFKSAAAIAAVTLVAGIGSLMLPTADAATLPSPDTVFGAWNDAFLVQQNGETYYTNELKSKGTARAGEWIAALDIQVAQDVYLRTHAPADRQLVVNLTNTLLAHEGTTWASWDGWNDNVAWMLTELTRAWQMTGNNDWLNTSIDQWNVVYNRGWTSQGGGGIWEEMSSKYSKCALSNDPMIVTGVQLYEATGDGTYLTKSRAIYDWVRSHIVNTTTGVVNECIAFPNGPDGSTIVQTSDNAYNAGSFIEAADQLYRVTGDTGYRDDAQRTADHFLNNVPVVANNGQRGSSYQYWLFKGMSDFCTDAGNCSRYDAYMRSNAQQAWNMRNSANLTWNDWNHATNDANPDAFEMAGMVALFQVLPVSGNPFSGSYAIQNNASHLVLTAQNGSTAASAPIVQASDDKSDSASWTLTPTSNGYYQIRNVHSGALLNVAGVSGKLGAAIVQWPAGGLVPGNDQWLPVRNSDGSYSFYNRNSMLALDIPAGSTTAGVQAQQWAPNDSTAQRFTLTSRSGSGSTGGGGVGQITSGVAGYCLDVTGGANANGTKLEIYGCNGTGAQSWTVPGDGTLRALGKCADVNQGGTANGSLVQLWDCNGTGAQSWTYNAGTKALVNPQSGRCLDDPGGATNGSQLIIWDCNGGTNQQWNLP